MEDRRGALIKAMFSDLDRIKAKSLESAIFKNRFFSQNKGPDLQMKKEDETFEKAGNELPLMTKGKRADRVAL